jgi:hypothetical protein
MHDFEYKDSKAQFWMRGLDLAARSLCAICVAAFVIAALSKHAGAWL